MTTLAIQPSVLQAEVNSQIIEFRKAQINIFSADGKQRLEKVDSESLTTPLHIIETLPSGYYVVEIEGQNRAVRKRVVRTDRVYGLTSTCSNQFAVNPAGTSRGLGNGEC